MVSFKEYINENIVKEYKKKSGLSPEPKDSSRPDETIFVKKDGSSIRITGSKIELFSKDMDLVKTFKNVTQALNESLLNEFVSSKKLYDALEAKNSDKFEEAMYTWFEKNMSNAALVAEEDSPQDFIEYLELKSHKKLVAFFNEMRKQGFVQ